MEPAFLAGKALAFLFLMTALAKVQTATPFLGMMEKLGFQEKASKALLVLFISLEFTLAVLWWTLWSPIPLTIFTVLLFIMMILSLELIWRKGHRESCGCYGTLAKVTPRQGIRLNLIYAAIAIFIWSESPSPSNSTFPLWALVVGLLLSCLALWRHQKKSRH
jgi:hypothetical protein